MTIYYATYAGLLMAVVLGVQGRDVRNALYWIVLIGMFLFSGYRYEVGCDWTGYLFHWEVWGPELGLNPWEFHEPAYWVILDYIKANNLPYTYINLVTSAIFFLGLHVMARTQPNPLAFIVLAFPILVINMPMSGIRQAAAIGFVTMAFVALGARRPVVFVALLGAGTLFHSSAMAFLLLTPFVYGRYSKRNIVLAAILASPGAYFMLQSEPAEIASDRYIDSGLEAFGSAFRLGILTLTGLFYFGFLQKRWKQMFPEDYTLASLGSLLMVCFFPIFFVSTVIGDRFGYYLIPIQLMIFTRLPYMFRGQKRETYALAPYALLTLVFVVWTQLSTLFEQCYIPYGTSLF
ncbi:EpsG family protein [Ovoidimarina sediminis]|uniref:EpsG family protein n=1 Tax=Ovoidimarina sediminis TaxID=3079856 RepID=UPI00290EE684|nr:EpsG family protein [Rhodophyticola sp. MJ-SS7]MDU8946139.1 EpsG family protein [Rhodophyticola sp. MJ-SS7]